MNEKYNWTVKGALFSPEALKPEGVVPFSIENKHVFIISVNLHTVLNNDKEF